MTGGALDDILYALSGSNQVDAGGGNDIVGYATGEVNVLSGGTGNDILVVHALNGSGLDFAVSGANVSDNYGSVITGFERFQVFGSAFADSVTGGDLKDNFLGGRGDDTLNGGNGNDVLLGQAGNDQLSGDAGNDRLNGGPGYDTMTGGQGADAFIFAQNDAAIDEITDFEASDTIVIRAYIYGITLPLGAVATLTLGAATTSDPQFIYNATSGLLIWDGDGVTPGHQIELALLSNVPTLLPSDIILI